MPAGQVEHRCPEVRQALSALLLALCRYGVSSVLVLRESEFLCVATTGEVVPRGDFRLATSLLAEMTRTTKPIAAHPDSAVQSALTRLCDELCSWERSTGRESVLILRHIGFVYRAVDGKPDVPDDMTDAELLRVVGA